MSNTTRRRCSSRTVRVRDLVALIAVMGATLGAMACSSSSSTAPNTGSLTVTIAAPAGVTPNVTVSGPGGYTKPLSATTTLTGLAAGSYTVAAAPVTTAAPIVGTVNTATVVGSPATVTANETATATATYTPRPGSGGLWVASGGGTTVMQYAAGQLGSTTSAAPATAIGTGALSQGVAFDANGNLWVTTYSPNSVLEYTASQLSASGTLMPAITLNATAGSLDVPEGLAFDASGNLWVANENDSSVVEFTVSQLASSGSPTPAVTISASSGSLNSPIGLAFDASGNLWVANFSDSTVVEFTSSQLAASGSPTPAITLSATTGSLSAPAGLAFDASGDLWVANAGNGTPNSSTVVEFAPSQLAATGTPTPAATLSTTAGSLNNPLALAFDATANLWVANAAGASVVEFTASQLVVSGSPTPNVTVAGSALLGTSGLAFDPHATGLPLKP